MSRRLYNLPGGIRKRGANGCFQIFCRCRWIVVCPYYRQVVVCVEMGLLRDVIKGRFFTGVYNRFAKAFCITGFPVSAVVGVAQVGNEKPAGLDFNAHSVVNKAGLRNIIKSLELETCFRDSRDEMGLDEGVKFIIAVLHRHERHIAGCGTALKLFDPFPTLEGRRSISPSFTALVPKYFTQN